MILLDEADLKSCQLLITLPSPSRFFFPKSCGVFSSESWICSSARKFTMHLLSSQKISVQHGTPSFRFWITGLTSRNQFVHLYSPPNNQQGNLKTVTVANRKSQWPTTNRKKISYHNQYTLSRSKEMFPYVKMVPYSQSLPLNRKHIVFINASAWFFAFFLAVFLNISVLVLFLFFSVMYLPSVHFPVSLILSSSELVLFLPLLQLLILLHDCCSLHVFPFHPDSYCLYYVFTLKHSLLKILCQISSKRCCFSFTSLFCALSGQPAVNTHGSKQTTGFTNEWWIPWSY